jgi:NADP-reducing hydrogenase subunit HndB
MPKIGSLEELKELRNKAAKDLQVRLSTGTRITVGLGTCGIAAGARETMRAIVEELDRRGIDATVNTVGCIGMCYNEPLVDIEQAGKPRVTYGNVTADRVPRIIEEHLKNGRVVEEWVVGRLEVGGD